MTTLLTLERRVGSLESMAHQQQLINGDVAETLTYLRGAIGELSQEVRGLKFDMREVKATQSEHSELLRAILAKLDER
ncbi:hypothetical protein [Dactylosporangium sp. CA-092794]|uniref:hypothetical protein n=1 Tax=Dactylosporangium sp. CA-092794 TaxID=3239929 RepID=UPI003D94F6F4